jgi:hypothetical protein
METLMADEPRLPQRAEQLLASFPLPERDWEEQARAIEARLATTALGSTEARWLDPPLAEEAPTSDPIAEPALGPTETPFPFDSMGSIIEAPASRPVGAPALPEASVKAGPATEPVAAVPAPAPAAATATPLPNNSQSLSALARSVAQKGGRTQSRDIARESLSVAAAARSHSDAMAERVRSARPMPPPSQRPAPPAQRPAAPSQRPAAPSQRPTPAAPPAATNNNGPWFAVGGLGIAAAIALWAMRPAAPVAQTAPEPPAIAAREVPQSPAAAAPAAKSDAPSDGARDAVAVATPPVGAATPSVAASALPLAPRVVAAAAPPAGHTGAELGASPRQAAAPTASVATADRPAPESIVLDDAPGSSKLAGAKGGAAPQASTGLRPAAGSPSGGLPDKPSTGAVQAAVGSVMGAARACVAGGAATPAQVIFSSSGAVQAVNVSGPNAGTPSASCIDAALRRARVAPFASPTFSLMVWVRP